MLADLTLAARQVAHPLHDTFAAGAGGCRPVAGTARTDARLPSTAAQQHCCGSVLPAPTVQSWLCDAAVLYLACYIAACKGGTSPPGYCTAPLHHAALPAVLGRVRVELAPVLWLEGVLPRLVLGGRSKVGHLTQHLEGMRGW